MKAVEDYEALAKDPDVDIVYVSNIHPAHKDASILMMNHGKHVLCEKPLAVSPNDFGLTADERHMTFAWCIASEIAQATQLHASRPSVKACFVYVHLGLR